ncbi:hypothetical protein GCM10027072_03630 [Streptomyces bullii]
MSREELDAYIRDMVADWPPFTPEQREGLRALLRTDSRPEPQPARAAA